MTRTSLKHLHCSWAQAADILADKWTMLILRDAFFGARTFSAFQQSFGVSKGVLTQRLELLVENGIMQKQPTGLGSSRSEYRLTEKGEALLPVFTALCQWSHEWVMREKKAPWIMVDKSTRYPVQATQVKSKSGKKLKLKDVTFEPGPGANANIRRIAKLLQATEEDSATHT